MIAKKLAVWTAAGLMAAAVPVATQAASRKHVPTKLAVAAVKNTTLAATPTKKSTTHKLAIQKPIAHKALRTTSHHTLTKLSTRPRALHTRTLPATHAK